MYIATHKRIPYGGHYLEILIALDHERNEVPLVEVEGHLVPQPIQWKGGYKVIDEENHLLGWVDSPAELAQMARERSAKALVFYAPPGRRFRTAKLVPTSLSYQVGTVEEEGFTWRRTWPRTEPDG